MSTADTPRRSARDWQRAQQTRSARPLRTDRLVFTRTRQAAPALPLFSACSAARYVPIKGSYSPTTSTNQPSDHTASSSYKPTWSPLTRHPTSGTLRYRTSCTITAPPPSDVPPAGAPLATTLRPLRAGSLGTMGSGMIPDIPTLCAPCVRK